MPTKTSQAIHPSGSLPGCTRSNGRRHEPPHQGTANIKIASVTIRHEGIPAPDLWDTICPGHSPPVSHEASGFMTRVVERARTQKPTMRNALRSHLVSVAAYLHEIAQRPEHNLQHEQSACHAADIYTNAFRSGDAWDHIACFIGAGDPFVMNVAQEVHLGASPLQTRAALREAAARSCCHREASHSAAQHHALG